MTAEEQYRKEINVDSFYRISIDNFKRYLRQNFLQERFAMAMNSEEIDVFEVAVDFSIPVIMVKYFQKVGFIPSYQIRR